MRQYSDNDRSSALASFDSDRYNSCGNRSGNCSVHFSIIGTHQKRAGAGKARPAISTGRTRRRETLVTEARIQSASFGCIDSRLRAAAGELAEIVTSMRGKGSIITVVSTRSKPSGRSMMTPAGKRYSISGGLFCFEVVEQALNGMNRRLFYAALGDLADSRKRNAGLSCDLTLRNVLGPQVGHHKVVNVV